MPKKIAPKPCRRLNPLFELPKLTRAELLDLRAQAEKVPGASWNFSWKMEVIDIELSNRDEALRVMKSDLK